MSETIETRNCEKHGDYQANVLAIFNGKQIISKCPECEDERKESEEQERKLAEQKRIEQEVINKRHEMISNGLMPRYIGITLEDFKPLDEQKAAYDACLMFALKFDEMCETGKTMFFCGTVGTGKTMLVHALIQTVGHGRYLRAVDISRMVRDCYSKNESEYDLIDSLARAKLLVIDEVGVQQDTKHESLLITDLIDRRYGNMLPTIICSNLNKDKLKETFGERAWDRLMQNGVIIPVLGKSQRAS